MPAIPPSDNRVLLAYEALKQEILSGELCSPLPGERSLATRLQVSRKTLRKAMELLEVDGWVSKAAHGKRRQVIKTSAPPKKSDTQPSLKNKVVITVAPRALHLMGGIERLFQNRLARYCEKAGITLLHRHIDVRHMQDPSYRLAEFLTQNPADAYLLQHSTAQIQQWFANNNVPSLILGDRWGDLRIPAVAGDHEAMAVHTAGLLQRHQHTSVALLMPTPQKRGLEIYAQKLKEAAPGVNFHLFLHEETPESTAAAVQKLLSTTPATLVITAYAFSTISLFSGAATLGKQVPKDLSLLSLSHDEVLNYLQPGIAAYDVDWENYTKTVLKSLSDLLRHPDSPIVDPALVMPRFLKGGSLIPSCSEG